MNDNVPATPRKREGGMMDLNVMGSPQPRRFTSDEYHAMAHHGIIPPGARLELLDGLIVERVSIGDRHMSTVDRFTRLVIERLGMSAHARVQGSVHLSMRTEPQPDLLLLRRRLDDYAHGPALTEDILALVEVADSSLAFDRGEKLRLYAQHRVPEYWIVNLIDDCIEIHREPHDLGYASHETFAPNQLVAFAEFCDANFAVADILPPPKPS
jgi:Uma2 family endonuclease